MIFYPDDEVFPLAVSDEVPFLFAELPVGSACKLEGFKMVKTAAGKAASVSESEESLSTDASRIRQVDDHTVVIAQASLKAG
ncbi:hypothetical protein [Rubripirellula lacrimiformis]|nr:hypothetical protein [Rubripirellula lacrimiformis]